MNSSAHTAGGSLDPGSEARENWRAAGVLPYSVLDGTVLCMLGKEYSLAPSTTRLLVPPKSLHRSDANPLASAKQEPKYRCWWSDFGGGREPEDVSVAHTAAREWAEETIGVYGDGSNLVSRVENSAKNMRAQLCDLTTTESSPSLGPTFAVVSDSYTMYACAVPFVDTLIFQLARDENDAEATAAAVCGTSRAETRSTTTDEEVLCKLRRRCGEKRDFAWVPLHQLLKAVGNGRTWLRDVDGQMITLLPRFGYALQASGHILLTKISEVLLGNSPGLCTTVPMSLPATRMNCSYQQGHNIIKLPAPSHRAGGCSVYLSVRRRPTTDLQVLENPAAMEGKAGEVLQDSVPASTHEVDVATSLLQDTVKMLPRFGGVRRAVLHRYASPSANMRSEIEQCSALRDPFVLVTFFCPAAAAEARRWLNSNAEARSIGGSPIELRTGSRTQAMCIEVFADFAFFEPKKRRRSSLADSDGAGSPVGAGGEAGRGGRLAGCAPKKTRAGRSSGYQGCPQTTSKVHRGAGRKSKLGVRPPCNAAAAAADGVAEHAALGNVAMTTCASACN